MIPQFLTFTPTSNNCILDLSTNSKGDLTDSTSVRVDKKTPWLSNKKAESVFPTLYTNTITITNRLTESVEKLY